MNTTTAIVSPPTPIKPAPSGTAFELTLDSHVYVSPGAAAIDATLLLRNHTHTPIALTFIDGQQFDLEIHDAGGDLISRWSTGRVFSDLAQTVEVAGVRTWTGSLPVPSLGGPIAPRPPIPPHPVSPGDAEPELIGLAPVPYTLTGYLTTGGAATVNAGGALHPYSATVAFAVQPRPVVPETTATPSHREAPR